MGYQDNNDKTDFLNALAGRIVTIDSESEDGRIFTCKEFPEYAIYDYLIKSVKTVEALGEDEYTYAEIAKANGITTQGAWLIVNKAIKKLKIIAPKNLELSLN